MNDYYNDYPPKGTINGEKQPDIHSQYAVGHEPYNPDFDGRVDPKRAYDRPSYDKHYGRSLAKDYDQYSQPYFDKQYNDRSYEKPADQFYGKRHDQCGDQRADTSSGKHYDNYFDDDKGDKYEARYSSLRQERVKYYHCPEEADFPTKRDRVNLLLLPEGQTGVPTDPTGMFAEEYGKDPQKLFKKAYGYALLDKDFPLRLDITLYAPRPESIGFYGWKYEGWLVDQAPQGRYSSATSVNPGFEGIINPDLDQYDYPVSTGIFRDTGLTLPNGLGVYKNTFYMDQSAWPYDRVVVTFEPPETGKGMKNYDPRPNPVRPVTGAIPGSIPKEG